MTDTETGESSAADEVSPAERAAADRAVADLLSLLGRRHTLSPTTFSERLLELRPVFGAFYRWAGSGAC